MLRIRGFVCALAIVFLLAVVCVILYCLEFVERTTYVNNLKDIRWALRKYEDDFGRFPPVGLQSPDRSNDQSWRALLLPYFDTEDVRDLERKYKLDEEWDSPSNRRLWDHAIYSGFKGYKRIPHCCYFAVVGSGDDWWFLGPRKLGRNDPIIIIEYFGLDIPWPEPSDLRFDGRQFVLTKDRSQQPIDIRGLNAIRFSSEVCRIPTNINQEELSAFMIGSWDD